MKVGNVTYGMVTVTSSATPFTSGAVYMGDIGSNILIGIVYKPKIYIFFHLVASIIHVVKYELSYSRAVM